MDIVPGLSLYPLQRCKVIHLLRHAQGIHNLEGAEKFNTSPELFDASLSPLGWEQVKNLRNHVRSCGLLDRIELVIASPLLRTMQTAAGVFGGDKLTNVTDETPLMVENAKSTHAAISNLNCPPFIAHELCRERIIESDDDVLWTADKRESVEDLAARGMKFMKWLWTRKEKEIAVVTHCEFLFQTLQEFGNDCHASVKNEICKVFSNCELRSMVLVDKGLNLTISKANGE